MRTKAQCLAAECSEDAYSLALCTVHYQRLRRSGRLDLPTIVERLLDAYEVDQATGCWIWSGGVSTDGYARISIGNEVVYAHRVSYETFIGPIPEGLTIDHVRERGCVHRSCINPNHLEPVSLSENSRRGSLARWHGSPVPPCTARAGDGVIGDAATRTLLALIGLHMAGVRVRVDEVAAATGRSRGAAYGHLAALRAAGLVAYGRGEALKPLVKIAA